MRAWGGVERCGNGIGEKGEIVFGGQGKVDIEIVIDIVIEKEGEIQIDDHIGDETVIGTEMGIVIGGESMN